MGRYNKAAERRKCFECIKNNKFKAYFIFCDLDQESQVNQYLLFIILNEHIDYLNICISQLP